MAGKAKPKPAAVAEADIPFTHGIDADLFAAVVCALEAAHGEFETLADPPAEAWPIPDDLQRILNEHAAMKATLKTMRQGFEGKGKQAAAQAMAAIYAKALAEGTGTEYRMPAAPLLDEVTAHVADALELVRRAGHLDGDVRAALRLVA
jgi:hypothetical protein